MLWRPLRPKGGEHLPLCNREDFCKLVGKPISGGEPPLCGHSPESHALDGRLTECEASGLATLQPCIARCDIPRITGHWQDLTVPVKEESREINRVDVDCDHRLGSGGLYCSLAILLLNLHASLQNLRDVQNAGAWDVLAGGTRTAAPAKAPGPHTQLALTGLLW